MRSPAAWIVSAVSLGTFALIAFAPHTQVHAQDNPKSPEFYTTKVQPIFEANCYKCHGGEFHRGGLSLATKEGMMHGGHDGPVIAPGDPANSLLIKLIRHEGPADDPMPMPPKGDKISDADIATVTAWIKAGAIVPAGQ